MSMILDKSRLEEELATVSFMVIYRKENLAIELCDGTIYEIHRPNDKGNRVEVYLVTPQRCRIIKKMYCNQLKKYLISISDKIYKLDSLYRIYFSILIKDRGDSLYQALKDLADGNYQLTNNYKLRKVDGVLQLNKSV